MYMQIISEYILSHDRFAFILIFFKKRNVSGFMGYLFSRTTTSRILLHIHVADDKTKDIHPLLNSFVIYSVYVDSGIWLVPNVFVG